MAEEKQESKPEQTTKKSAKQDNSKIALDSFLSTIDIKLRKAFKVWLQKKENKSHLEDRKKIPEWKELVEKFLKSEA